MRVRAVSTLCFPSATSLSAFSASLFRLRTFLTIPLLAIVYSALVSLHYTARNMVETCDVLFTNFPGLLEKPDYKDQVIEIMQEPKQYILKLEGETDNEQH